MHVFWEDVAQAILLKLGVGPNSDGHTGLLGSRHTALQNSPVRKRFCVRHFWVLQKRRDNTNVVEWNQVTYFPGDRSTVNMLHPWNNGNLVVAEIGTTRSGQKKNVFLGEMWFELKYRDQQFDTHASNFADWATLKGQRKLARQGPKSGIDGLYRLEQNDKYVTQNPVPFLSRAGRL
jgi:hypothetical protein